MLILHSSDAADFFDGMSLKDAFWQFVLHDPEVQMLGRKAIKADSGLERVYLQGWCYPSGRREWPVIFPHGALAGGRSPNSPIGYLAGPLPPAVQRAADIVCLRYSLLLTLLRHKELEAIGDPVRARGTDQILSSIWTHRSYYIDIENGDVLQIKNGDIADFNDFLTKRWRAVMLRKPLQASVFHVKPLVPDVIRSHTIESQHASKSSGKAIARVNTTTTAFKACRDWLVEIMQASPKKRTETKSDLWKKAQKRWPGTLSERSFLAARTEAIHITGANTWSAAGASRKSQRKSAH